MSGMSLPTNDACDTVLQHAMSLLPDATGRTPDEMRVFVQTDLGQAKYMSALRIFLQSLGRACAISQQSDHAQETTSRARKRRKTQQTSSRILELCPQGSQQIITPTADTEVTASTRQYTATVQNVDVAHDHVHRAVSNQGSTTPTATRSLPSASPARSGRDISYGSIIEELGLEADLSSVPAHLCEMQRLAGNHDLQKEWWSTEISFMNSFKHGTAIYIASEIDCRRSRHRSQDVLLTHILADIVEQEVANEKDENTSGPLPHRKTVRSVVIDRAFDKFSKDNSSNPVISLTRKKVVALIREGQRLMRLAPGLLFCLSSLSKAVLQKLTVKKIDQLNKELEKHKVLQQYLGLADIQKELQASYHTILNEKKSEAQRHEFPGTSPCLAESLEVASTHRAQTTSHDLDLIQQITDHVRLSRMFTFLQPVHIETVIPLLRGAGGLVRRWNSDGEVVQANPIDDGIATDVVQLLENQVRYDTAVDLWRSRRGIRLSDEEQVDELESYKQILLLVGRIFPVDQNLHLGYRSLGVALVPSLAYLLNDRNFVHAVRTCKEVEQELLALCFLSASRFSGPDKPTWTDLLAKSMKCLPNRSDLIYLRLWNCERQIFLRNRDRNLVEKMQGIIDTVKEKCQTINESAICRARLAILLKQQADSAVMNLELDQALQYVEHLKALLQESDLERLTKLDIDVCKAKLLRYKGNLVESSKILKDVLESRTTGHRNTAYFRTVAEDTYTSIEYLAEHGRESLAHEEIHNSLAGRLVDAIHELESGDRYNTSVCHRLRLALAEENLQRSNLPLATEAFMKTYTALHQLFEPVTGTGKDRPSLLQQSLYLQASLGVAKVHHSQGQWPDAITAWNRALEVLEKYRMKGEYVEDLILLLIA